MKKNSTFLYRISNPLALLIFVLSSFLGADIFKDSKLLLTIAFISAPFACLYSLKLIFFFSLPRFTKYRIRKNSRSWFHVFFNL